MEEIINDELGNVITVRYDVATDVVTFNNNSIDSIFHVVSKCFEETDPKIICVEGHELWDQESDVVTRWKVGEFFWANKVNP
jgi:hypothetical protein